MATASEEKEGKNLLGPPTFKKLENGRFKCVQTGHEVLDKDKESYSSSKRCRLGLVDFALSRNKPPLNMFKSDPLSRSKLICKLTGDTVNKSEEHLWKHINGKRFLNKLEEMESQELTPDGMVELNEKKVEEESNKDDVDQKTKKNKNKKKKKKKKDKDKDKPVEEIVSEMREPNGEGSDSEEDDFWVPPEGDRWDFDDGGDRWGSGSESENGSDGEDGTAAEGEGDDDDDGGGKESEGLSVRTKRMSIEIGPSSFAPRKKKPKKEQKECSV